MAKRNKKIARAMRSGTAPYTKAARSGNRKRPCPHCQETTAAGRRRAFGHAAG